LTVVDDAGIELVQVRLVGSMLALAFSITRQSRLLES